MSVDRPTFHESWSRVAGLAPALRATVQARRQRLRGRVWWILHDPATNEFSRVSAEGWRFVGLLDGRRTVAQAWAACSERWGDEAPTQGEVIELLGHLLSGGLLRGDTPFDAEALLKRQRRRSLREARSRLGGLLFVRVPLVDPDPLLERWAPVFDRLFTPVAFVLWVILVGSGLWAAAGEWARLEAGAVGALSPGNLPLLYLAFVATKLAHEMAHAMACKVFGRRAGAGGAVHTLGVMFLLFLPVPYVDASSAWALRSKTQRVVVGAAGMMADLAMAAVAAWVWSRASEGSAAGALSWSVMMVAGVSTLLFNANPLLRYDAYYMLSDVLETPNLAQRARDTLIYVWKRLVWGVRRAVDPSHSRAERRWLVVYGAGAGVYRAALTVAIILLLLTHYPLVGTVLAAGAVWMWAIAPLGRLIRTLQRAPDLDRVRARAVWTTALVAGALLVLVCLVPAPDRVRATGVVEPARFTPVFAAVDGFVTATAPTGSPVRAGGAPVVRTRSAEALMRRDGLRAQVAKAQAERQRALAAGPAEAQIAGERLGALSERLAQAERDAGALTVLPPSDGVWVNADPSRLIGRRVARGERLGAVVGEGALLVRAAAEQPIAALLGDADERVEIRLSGAPALRMTGRIRGVLPAGRDVLPSAALGYSFGGEIETRAGDGEPGRAADSFFEVRVEPDAGSPLLPGQRVVVRFELPRKPIGAQVWRRVAQALQGRERS